MRCQSNWSTYKPISHVTIISLDLISIVLTPIIRPQSDGQMNVNHHKWLKDTHSHTDIANERRERGKYMRLNTKLND